MQFSETALARVRADRLLIDEVDTWLFEEIAPFLGRRILEMGCGHGNFARHLTDRECYVGLDIDVASVEIVTSTYAGQDNMTALVADAADLPLEQLRHFRFDTVFSLNVLEHIADDQAVIRNAFALLQPGGVFILVVPAHRWLHGAIDDAIGHYRRYDGRLAKRMFGDAGFDIVYQKYINILGAFGWLVSSRLLRQEVPPSGQLKLFNRLVPALKRAERLIPPPIGISLLTVGRKSL